MRDLIITNDNQILVSSKDISDAFGKVHRNVMRAIKDLDCSDEFRVTNFEQSTFTSLQNKILPCVNMTKDGFAFLCMGFTGKEAAQWKEKYIKAFNKMESALSKSLEKAPKSMEDLNAISKRIENLNDIGSFHGQGLAKFAKDKRREVKVFELALEQAQMSLGV